MGTFELIEAFAIGGPIVALVVLGFAICAQSGGVEPRRLAGNLSRAVLVLGACLLGLAAIQQLVGFRLDVLG